MSRDPAGYYRKTTAAQRRQSEADDVFLRLRRLLARRRRQCDQAAVIGQLFRLKPDEFTRPLDPFPRLLTLNSNFVQHGDNDPEPAVAVYEERETLGFQIFHPDDRFIEQELRWGTVVHTTISGNGEPVCGHLVRLGAKRWGVP